MDFALSVRVRLRGGADGIEPAPEDVKASVRSPERGPTISSYLTGSIPANSRREELT